MVSAVGDSWVKKSPWENDYIGTDIWKERIVPLIPNPGPGGAGVEDMEKYIEAVRIAKKFDIENDEADCVDPEKHAFLDEMIRTLGEALVSAAKDEDNDEVANISHLIYILDTEIREYL